MGRSVSPEATVGPEAGALRVEGQLQSIKTRPSRVRRRSSAVAPARMRFRRAPLAAAAISLACGIGLARLVYQPVLVLAVALGALAGLSLVAILWAGRVAWLPVAAVWVVVGMAAAEWQTQPPSAALQVYADGLSRTVEGRVERVRLLPPRQTPGDQDRVEAWDAAETEPEDSGQAVSLDLAVSRVEHVTPDLSTMVPAAGGVRVLLPQGKPGAGETGAAGLRCGDRVTGDLRLKRLERFRDPGAWQYADYLEAQGIGARANAVAGSLQRFGTGVPGWACRLEDAQAWASRRLERFVQSPGNRRMPPLLRLNLADARMLNAMLFGDRTGLDRALRTDFERTGTFHLFVVSGLHIALLAGGVFWLFRRLRAPLWLATLATLACATAYAGMTGFGQPAQRSLAMVSIFLLARLLSRERDPFNALGAAALGMLLWAPSSLFEAGFQMTVLAVVAIAGLAHPLAERWFLVYARAAKDVFRPRRAALGPRAAQFRLTLETLGEALALLTLALAPGERLGSAVRYVPALVVRAAVGVLHLALLGIVTELVMALPMALYFHRAALFALPANMVVIPVVALLAGAGVATFVGSLLSPWIAVIPAAATALLLHGITAVIARIGHLQAADVRVPGPLWGIALLALGMFGVCCWAVRRSRWGSLAAAMALPLIAALVLWPEPPVHTPGALEVTALDVGQGDSLLVVGPDGRTMLVDAGGPIGRNGAWATVAAFDVGEEVVSPYLWSRRFRRLDVVVLSHAHTDHMGGMPAVLENFRPRELWVGIDPRSTLYASLLAEAARLGIRVRHFHAGDQVQWGAVGVSALAPQPGYSNGGAAKNDDSLVLQLQFGRASVLLEGDAERPSEDSMLASGSVHPVTLLKVGHHGSNTSTTPEFLAAVAPEDAVVSSGRGNPFGHPRGEVIARLAAEGAHVFRVDEFGLTTFLLTPGGRVREVAGLGELPSRAQR